MRKFLENHLKLSKFKKFQHEIQADFDYEYKEL